MYRDVFFPTGTSNVGATATISWACFSHTIHREYARGNQHQRIEHGSCVLCGKKFKRVIRWGTRDAKTWWEAA